MPFLALPLEIRLQIWTYIVQPAVVYPCNCTLDVKGGNPHRTECSCDNISTYKYCDNRILRLNRQIFAEVQPLVKRAEEGRVFVLCNNLCIDSLFRNTARRDWKWVKHIKVDLFVGWGCGGQDDWFLCQSQRWARRYVLGALDRYSGGRDLTIQPEEDVKEDSDGRRTLTVDIYLE